MKKIFYITTGMAAGAFAGTLFALWAVGVIEDILESVSAVGDTEQDDWTIQDWAEWWGSEDE